jgi:hypothetical protein
VKRSLTRAERHAEWARIREEVAEKLDWLRLKSGRHFTRKTREMLDAFKTRIEENKPLTRCQAHVVREMYEDAIIRLPPGSRA